MVEYQAFAIYSNFYMLPSMTKLHWLMVTPYGPYQIVPALSANVAGAIFTGVLLLAFSKLDSNTYNFRVQH